MATLLDSILAMASKAEADVNVKLAEAKHEKSKFARLYEARISSLNAEKDDQRLLKEQTSSEKKNEKIREDFLKKLMSEGSGPVAVGGNLVDSLNVPVEEGAGDFPVLPS
jgi:hypothetical protein